ncbi:MAG: hypothetical protein AAGN35_08190 [Bacteroidota bacterium]
MDLKELWNSPDVVTDPAPQRAELAAMLNQQSTGILVQLRKKLLYKILWGLGIGLAALGFLLLNPYHAATWLVAGLLIPMVIVLGTKLLRYYQRLPNRLDMDRKILPVMQEYDTIVREALRFEERIGTLFIIPAPALGAMVALLEEEMTFAEMLSNGKILLLLIGVIAVISPLAIWLSKWMNRLAFQKYLDQLAENIRALKELAEG